jgi:hypothetical protein
MRLTLPNTLRRAELRGFVLAISSIALIALAFAASFSWPARYAAMPVVCACLFGLLFPPLARIPYRIWNKSAKLFVCFAHYYVLGVVFHLIVRVMSVAVTSPDFSQGSQSSSTWVPRCSVSPASYRSLYHVGEKDSVRGPWPFTVFGWAWQTANIPAMCLLPFLYMLSIFQPEKESEKVSDIYTLF